MRGYHWRLTEETQLDEVWLDDELVLYPIEADERQGWVRHWIATENGNRTRAYTVSYGVVEIVHALTEDPFID